ncbi:uncharacterized protein LOC133929559 [Phragmites australis]|uniref:uncharacterized protein LOC133929559 n=1 Tax=Phragmites australis TaxID=29695 RepID=UPI002D7802C4|nr:uncharacterized protein LOC133929559 [Phragmites australis]
MAMARHPALLAPLLLLLVVSHLPSSAPATTGPTGNLLAKADDNATSSSSPLTLAPSVRRDDEKTKNAASKEDKEEDDDDDKGDDREKKDKEEKEKEKEEEEKKKEKEEENGLVSFTNGTGSYKGMAREFVNGHNKLRARYGVPPMKWDNKLARHARRWSNAMRKDCVLKHSGSNYGESVYASKNGWNATAKDALWSWSDEEPLYDKLTGNCTGGRHFRECGHFALMVREKNRKIGCGRAECYKGGVFITCNYYLLDHD